MSISFEILGKAGRDNAMFVRIDSGQSLHRLLFDCGDGCLSSLTFADIQAIDVLFFSHLHMDHVGGFDNFFRCNFSRDAKPNVIFGPPGSGQILQHRFQGYLWNLHQELRGTWRICEVHSDRLQTWRYELVEAFSVAHEEDGKPFHGVLIDAPDFTVEALAMDHLTPSLAYVVREKPRSNIDVSELQTLGLRPGPWLKQLKEATPALEFIEVNGVSHSVSSLRQSVLTVTPGDSVAYLTDFLMDESALSRLAETLRGCKIIVCESQYCRTDQELAQRNYHMTCTLAAEAAKRVGAEELVLFHLSDRYTPDVWAGMLRDAQHIFPSTRFPDAWPTRRPGVGNPQASWAVP